MKLNNKILISNLILSVVILAISSVGLYYLVTSSVYYELDNHLLQHKHDIVEQVHNDPETLEQIKNLGGLGSYEWIEITSNKAPQNVKTNQFETIDTVRSTTETHPETYRRISTVITVGNQDYSLNIYEEVASWQKISTTILLSVLFGLLLWVILLYVVNQYVFDRVLAPFYNTVDTLETISQPTDFEEQFPGSSTHEIDVLNSALNTMMTQIRTSFEDQKKFILNVSHELLTPLSIIRHKTEKILSRAAQLDRQLVETAHEIQATTIRLSRLSNALLQISRVENRQYALNEQVDIREVAETVLAELKDFITLKNIDVKRDFDSEISVQGNCELLESAVYNVIQNAVKFSPENSTVTISTQTNSSGEKELHITDSGPGISEDIKKSLFKRFEKGKREGAQNGKNRGNGLGLALVNSICELHSFTCSAENREETGAKFTIQF